MGDVSPQGDDCGSATSDVQVEEDTHKAMDDNGSVAKKQETTHLGESEKSGEEPMGAENDGEAGPLEGAYEGKAGTDKEGGVSEEGAQRGDGQDNNTTVNKANSGSEESKEDDRKEGNITASDTERDKEVKGQGEKEEDKETGEEHRVQGKQGAKEMDKEVRKETKVEEKNGTPSEKEKEKGGKREKEKEDRKGKVKTKRKSGGNPAADEPSSPCSAPPPLTRPRGSARSLRGATKRDIMAKFQKDAPETPVVRNFKVQKSSMGMGGAMGGSIKQKVLQWCHNKTRNYEGVNIENFSSSWCDGLAFCALVHRFFPDAFDYSTLTAKDRRKNFTLAFSTAELMADCCPLLEVDDMILMGNNPDPLCVFTYVQSLCQHLSKIEKERREKKQAVEEASGETRDGPEAGRNTGKEGAGEGEEQEHKSVGATEVEDCGRPERAGERSSARGEGETACGGKTEGAKDEGKALVGEGDEAKEEAEAAPEGAPGGTPEGAPGERPEGAPGERPEGAPGGTPEGAPGETPEGAPGERPEGAPGGTPEGAPGETPEGAPGERSEGAPGGTPEGAPGERPEGAPVC